MKNLTTYKPLFKEYSSTLRNEIELQEGFMDIAKSFKEVISDFWNDIKRMHQNDIIIAVVLDFLIGTVGLMVVLFIFSVYYGIIGAYYDKDIQNYLITSTQSTTFIEASHKFQQMSKQERMIFYKKAKNDDKILEKIYVENPSLQKDGVNLLKKYLGLKHTDIKTYRSVTPVVTANGKLGVGATSTRISVEHEGFHDPETGEALPPSDEDL